MHVIRLSLSKKINGVTVNLLPCRLFAEAEKARSLPTLNPDDPMGLPLDKTRTVQVLP